ncbi:MAG: hypothetical protein AAGI38_01080 [Bacteroidota bacterium]
MKQLLPLLFLGGFLINLSLYGQDIFTSTSDSVWVYRLTSEQQTRWVKGKTDWRFEHQPEQRRRMVIRESQKVATLPRDTIAKYKEHPLPLGMYLWVYVRDNLIRSFGDHRTGLRDLLVLPGSKQSWIWIQHQSVSSDSLVLTLNGNPLSYDPEKGLFRLDGKKKKGVLRIQAGENATFYDLRKKTYTLRKQYLEKVSPNDDPYLSSRKPDKDDEWLGYLAFNKPRYRPGDTLKLKAYCMDKKGKPLNVPLQLAWQAKNLKLITPTRPGLYLHELILTDSLSMKLDKRHSFRLQHTKMGVVTQNGFMYEDYELDEATFHLKMDKSSVAFDQPLKIFAYTQDANGLDLPGGKVEIKISFDRTTYSPSSHTYLPRVLYHDTLDLATSKLPILTLEPDQLPKVRSSYTVTANFTTESREQQTMSTGFDLTAPKRLSTPEIRWAQDSLFVELSGDTTARVF